MSQKRKIILLMLPPAVLVALLIWYLRRHNVAVLTPAGEVGRKERQLIFIALLLSAIVVIPVYSLTILIAFKYRESNTRAKYNPDWDHSRLLESIWWGIPLIIISILSVITWNSSHSLDPFKPLNNGIRPMTIQVVALDWKWLFIYPDSRVASVNRVVFPVNTPINFFITSDSVMNSFWVPNLGGQIYAMPGMMTQIHLIADKTGSFYGASSNISGRGFAGMHFLAVSTSKASYNLWLDSLKHSPQHLNESLYSRLARPSSNNPVSYYSDASSGLFTNIIMKYMAPPGEGLST